MNTRLVVERLARGALGLLVAVNDRVAGRLALVVVIGLTLAFGAWVVRAAEAAFGHHPASQAATWTARDLRFDADSSCGSCHTESATVIAASLHAGTACQACHGPLADHAKAEPPTPVSPLDTQRVDADCKACHVSDPARPVRLAQVDLDEHYAAGSCIDCHDPHASTGNEPPQVHHPLAHLPECLTCHAVLKVRPATAGHAASPDDVCLSCHGPRPDGQAGGD